MNHDSNHSAFQPRFDTAPRVFAIMYLGDGMYALDRFYQERPPSRLRCSRSLRVLRRHLAKIQSAGDKLLMSEVLRAFELCSERAALRADGAELFQRIETLETLHAGSGASADHHTQPGTASPERAPKHSFPAPNPRNRLDGTSSPADNDDRDPGCHGPSLN